MSRIKATKRIFVCAECGSIHPRWYGQCPQCKHWNQIAESVEEPLVGNQQRLSVGYAGSERLEICTLASVDPAEMVRFSTGSGEFDRVLGGGIVPGSVLLLGGFPGAGKSTLLLQMLSYVTQSSATLYVSGEESLQQIAVRAERLQLPTENLLMYAQTRIDLIVEQVVALRPQLVVIDSIQVMQLPEIQSAAGSVVQVKECAAALTRLAKSHGIAMLMVGHVTKEGQLAGPKVLEHCIDASLRLEGEQHSKFRTLRSVKNRFGAVHEIGIFAMTQRGLVEVKNPSAIFLNRELPRLAGRAIGVLWEGTRALLVEIQGLADPSILPMPRRVAVGIEQNRLGLLLAILHRHAQIATGNQDIFLNVVGGLKITETGADLACVLALISSLRDRPLPEDLVVFGELGLGGELRPVPNGRERLLAAAKHGFKRAIVPSANAMQSADLGLTIHSATLLKEAIDICMDAQ